MAALAEAGDEVEHRVGAGDALVVGAHRQPPGPEGLVDPALTVDVEPGVGADAVADHREPAAGGDRGVLLAQRAGGGVARVGEDLLAGPLQIGVEGGEVLNSDEDLAAGLEEGRRGRRRGGVEAARDRLDGAGVRRDVLADAPVAAGGGRGERAVDVLEVDGQAVDLHLAQPDGLGPEGLDGARHPLAQLVDAEDVVEAEHLLGVLDGGEVGGLEGGADALGGAVGRAQFGELVLEALELDHHRVVGGVGEHGGVVAVVGLLGVVDEADELGVPTLTGGAGLGRGGDGAVGGDGVGLFVGVHEDNHAHRLRPGALSGRRGRPSR